MPRYKTVPNIITIEKIVETLCPEYIARKKKEQDKIKILKIGKKEKSKKFPKNFKKFFKKLKKKYYRHGVHYADPKRMKKSSELDTLTNNSHYISFFSSLMFCLLNTDYIESEIMQYINFLTTKIKKDLEGRRLYTQNKYFSDYGWRKKDLKDPLYKNMLNSIVVQYIADYLYINLWIFDSSTENVLCFPALSKDRINPYYKHVILYKSDLYNPSSEKEKNSSDSEESNNEGTRNFLEDCVFTPITQSKKRVFRYNSSIIRYLLTEKNVCRANVSLKKDAIALTEIKQVKLKKIAKRYNKLSKLKKKKEKEKELLRKKYG